MRTVLLVEDVPLAQKVATLILEEEGCRVFWAGSGRQALQLAAQVAVDLICMDLHLPDGDGLSLTQQIRQHPGPNQQTPIVALTANDGLQYRKKAQEVGMNGFLVKPLVPSQAQKVLAEFTTGVSHELATS